MDGRLGCAVLSILCSCVNSNLQWPGCFGGARQTKQAGQSRGEFAVGSAHKTMGNEGLLGPHQHSGSSIFT